MYFEQDRDVTGDGGTDFEQCSHNRDFTRMGCALFETNDVSRAAGIVDNTRIAPNDGGISSAVRYGIYFLVSSLLVEPGASVVEVCFYSDGREFSILDLSNF